MDTQKLIIGIMVIIIIIILAVMIMPHNENTNDDSNITIIKNSTSGKAYISSSTHKEYYDYDLVGIMKNIPSNLNGYTVKSNYYDENGDFLHESTSSISSLYEYAQKNELCKIAHWEANSLYNISKIEVIVENPTGDVVFNQSYVFDMSKMDLTGLDEGKSDDNSAHYSVEGQVNGKSYSYDVDVN